MRGWTPPNSTLAELDSNPPSIHFPPSLKLILVKTTEFQLYKDSTLPVLDSNFEPTLDLLGLKINGTVVLPTTEAQPSILECLKFNSLFFGIVERVVMVQESEFNNQVTQSTPFVLSPPWLSLIKN